LSQTVQLLELDYARQPRRWRMPWRRLLVVAALVIAAPFVFRRAMMAYRTLQARTAADRQLRSYFKQCLAYSQSDASPIFDEARDACPIDLASCSGQGPGRASRRSERHSRSTAYS